MTYWNRPVEERELIDKAYQAEVELIDTLSADTNPYYKQIMSLPDGANIWQHIDLAIALRYHNAEE